MFLSAPAGFSLRSRGFSARLLRGALVKTAVEAEKLRRVGKRREWRAVASALALTAARH